MEFFNYLKMPELTYRFFCKPPDHSVFSRYMSSILAYCLQLSKRFELILFEFKDKLVNTFYMTDAVLQSGVAKNATS